MAASRSLLVIHHTPGTSLPAMLDAVLAGTTADGISGVSSTAIAALEATSEQVLAADAVIVGTPANLGYMSGALKHFFDTVYNDCLDHTVGRPWGMFVHGESDTTGAVASIDRVVTGLRWQKVTPDVAPVGELHDNDLERCWELGASVAAHLMVD
jgi:multimeric flavodoxin WrbA